MKYTAVFLLSIMLLGVACKSSNKTSSATAKADTKSVTRVSNITLHDKPLAVISEHIENQKWQKLYAVGGITGKDRIEYDESYVTFTDQNQIITEEKGVSKTQKFKWEAARDIFTGDSTYVIKSLNVWKVDGIYNDTLRLADNYPDGYSYALIRAK